VEEHVCGAAGLKGRGIGFWRGGQSAGIDVVAAGEAQASGGASETWASGGALRNTGVFTKENYVSPPGRNPDPNSQRERTSRFS
jgi:hypothetical protein